MDCAGIAFGHLQAYHLRQTKEQKTMAESRYDVAIIGAGFSGPILAANIAEKGVNPKQESH